VNALALTILGAILSAILNLVLIVAWAIVRGRVNKTLHDLNAVSQRGRDTLYALIEAEGTTNPDLRRGLYLSVLKGTYKCK